MSWLLIAVVGYICLAVVQINDKLILAKSLPQQSHVAYTFYVAIFGLATVVLAPFGFSFLAPDVLLWAAGGGLLVVLSLYCLFWSLNLGSASAVLPFVGGATALLTFLFSNMFLGEKLIGWQLWAFVLLVVGLILIAIAGWQQDRHVAFKALSVALIAALASAGYYVISKYLFTDLGFSNGFIWLRVFAALFAMLLLLSSNNRQLIFAKTKKLHGRVKMAFVGNQVLGGIGFLLTNYAISLASVTLVNALLGLQYAFVLLIVFVLQIIRPKLLHEKLTPLNIFLKTAAIVVIAAGLWLLA